MKKTIFLVPLLAIALLSGCTKTTSDSTNSNPSGNPTSNDGGGSPADYDWQNDNEGNYDGYYSDIPKSLRGTELLNALKTLNNKKRKKTIGYKELRYKLPIFDANPDGGGKIVGFYNNELVGPSWDNGSTWNREHVWPNVRGGSKVEDDAHMVRPTAKSINEDRGSKGYSTKSYDPGQFVPYYRGSASRIIFYCAIADPTLKLIEDPLNYSGIRDGLTDRMGCLSEMLAWCMTYHPAITTYGKEDDLARRTELSRNNLIETHKDGQGNRNPFIDHPELGCKIWGDTNDQTRAACGIKK